MRLGRIWSLVIKELLTLFRDPRSRLIIMATPLIQLFLFSFAATLEVKNISLVIYNEDQGKHGYELIQRFAASPTIVKLAFVNSNKDLTTHIEQQKSMSAVHIPQNFSRTIEAGNPATIQTILDGRNSNSAQIINGYISTIAFNYGEEIIQKSGISTQEVIVLQNWFNKNLQYLWYTVPCLIGILGAIIALITTSLSVARERELGTFDQMLVSPLRPHEILIGKIIPGVFVGFTVSFIMFLAAVFVFRIPFTGSLALLFSSILIFIFSIVGVGLFISSISKTQQQALLGTFIFLVPAITLSGYASPVSNMPQWLQHVVWINPFKHFLISIKGIFLKDMPIIEVWANTWPLLIIGACTLTIAGWFFAKRLE